MNIAYCMDCMDAMKQMPDKCFDLAVVDPPYGGGGGSSKTQTEPVSVAGLNDTSQMQVNHAWGGRFERYNFREQDRRQMGGEIRKKIISWDYAPSEDYFTELFRVSKNQIIWGGNYFSLPPTRCFLIWHKQQIPEHFTMAMAEYAWCSFNDNAKIFSYSSAGQEGRFHPTQKPIALYAWIFQRYAKMGDKILDTHLGSGSSRIAAYNAGLDFVGFEIDPEYFQKQEERFAAHSAQTNLFIDGGET